MSTVQILYEQYKVLPIEKKFELKQLINEDESEMIQIDLPEFKKAVNQVKLFREGKVKTTPARQFLDELEKELAL